MNPRLKSALKRELHPTYDIKKSYDWNYKNGPLFRGPYPPGRTGQPAFNFLGFKLYSPLGIAAGPLLNSRWISTYAKLGFDILSYKTVRTRRRASNKMPNCVFVDTRGQLTDDRMKETLNPFPGTPERIKDLSITNSFGVPSKDPSEWQKDVARAKKGIGKGQVLIVSTLGSSEAYPDAAGFIRDFARTSALAKEAGADIVELDLSCPNSNAAEGMVYLDADLSGAISKASKAAVGDTPLLIKVGNFWDRGKFESVIRANAPHVEGIVGINTVKMAVNKRNGSPALPGRPESGVCGAGIQASALQFIRWIVESRRKNRYDFAIVGVGGIMTPTDIDWYLSEGVEAVEVATAAMWDPYLAYRYRLEGKKR